MGWSPSNDIRFRWIEDIPRSGSLHMAIDDWLTLNRNEAIIRLYDWLPQTVSLGFHQKSERIDFEKLNALGLGICRRPTGGRTVVHDAVVTYSVIVPLNGKSEPSLWDLYHWVGEWWADALHSIGVPVEFVAEPLSRPGAQFDGCFASGNRYEVAVNGRKLLGSAQRRYSNAALQHGSLRLKEPRIQARNIFFESNPNEPDESSVATTMEEALGRTIDAKTVYAWLKGAFLSKGYSIFDSEITTEELELASLEQDTFRITTK